MYRKSDATCEQCIYAVFKRLHEITETLAIDTAYGQLCVREFCKITYIIGPMVQSLEGAPNLNGLLPVGHVCMRA